MFPPGVQVNVASFVFRPEPPETPVPQLSIRLISNLVYPAFPAVFQLISFILVLQFEPEACDHTYDVALRFYDPEARKLVGRHYAAFTPRVLENQGYGFGAEHFPLDGVTLQTPGTYVMQIEFENAVAQEVQLPVAIQTQTARS